MMLTVFSYILVVWLNSIAGYKILGVFPFPGKSHYIVFDSLMVELANRGHQVIVYNTFPKDFQIPNYHEVNIEHCFKIKNDLRNINPDLKNVFRSINFALEFLPTEKEILSCEPLIQLANSTDKYDLLITEMFHTDFFQYFGHKLKIPVITFHSSLPYPWMSSQLGTPDNPSYILHPYSAFSAKMNFRQRISNVLYYVYSLFYYKIKSEYLYDAVAKKFFGLSVPPLDEITRNVSLCFLYTHVSLYSARPFTPNVIEVGGLNIKKPKVLDENIEKFINESTHGVVYFCMGSLLRGETFPAEKRDAFLYAFSKIPQRVLWKWEGDVLPGKSENIMTSKWMPQRDILAHPNVKLFISHGGLLGTSEAVYEGVPVIGIPIFGDQRTNVKALEANGAGELLDYNDISGEVVLEKIQRLLNDPKYKENARQLSIRYKDRPMSPLDTAVYWTEYVIRHKGAPHLKTAAVDMPWYQYLLLDVIAFLIFILVSVILIIYYSVKISLRYLCALIFGNSSSLKPTKKVKDN